MNSKNSNLETVRGIENNNNTEEFEDLAKELINSGLFAFVNIVDKRVLVIHSLNMMKAFIANLTHLKQGTHSNTLLQQDFNTNLIRLRILDQTYVLPLESQYLHNTKLLMKKQYWMDTFVSNGYSLYNKKDSLKYTVKYAVIKALIHVQLVNKMHKAFTVGIFDSVLEAKQFKETHYPTDEIYEIIYADNEYSDKIQKL